jgi:hypothetical protein
MEFMRNFEAQVEAQVGEQVDEQVMSILTACQSGEREAWRRRE